MTERLNAGQVSKMKEEVPLPSPPSNHPPALVLGGDEDVIVDRQALEESGEVYKVQPVILNNAAHDIMLVGFSPCHCPGSGFWIRRRCCERLILCTQPVEPITYVQEVCLSAYSSSQPQMHDAALVCFWGCCSHVRAF